MTREGTAVWFPDVVRFREDPAYVDAVETFVAHHVPRGSVTDAAVLEDEAGVRTFATTSWYRDGEFLRDATGRPQRVPIIVPLDPEVTIP